MIMLWVVALITEKLGGVSWLSGMRVIVPSMLNVTLAGMPIIAASSSAARDVHLCPASSHIPSIDSSTFGVFGSFHGWARVSSAVELTIDAICARRSDDVPAASQQQITASINLPKRSHCERIITPSILFQ